MRSIWRGAVSFGLVSIGVKLYTATEDHDIRFNQVHAVDGGRIKYRRGWSLRGGGGEGSPNPQGEELPPGHVGGVDPAGFGGGPPARPRGGEGPPCVDQGGRHPHPHR